MPEIPGVPQDPIFNQANTLLENINIKESEEVMALPPIEAPTPAVAKPAPKPARSKGKSINPPIIPKDSDVTNIIVQNTDGTFSTRDVGISDELISLIEDGLSTKDKEKVEFILRDRSIIDPQSSQANEDFIAMSQKISAMLRINNPDIDLSEKEMRSAYFDNIDSINLTLNKLISTTNLDEFNKLKEVAQKRLDEFGAVVLTEGMWASGWHVMHLTRLADKHPVMRPFVSAIEARRESREQFNNRGFRIVESYFKDTSTEQSERLSSVSVILDAFANKFNRVLGAKDIEYTPEGGLIVTLPKEVPKSYSYVDDEGAERFTMSPEDYDITLSFGGFKKGETITLTPDDVGKLQSTQASFKWGFDTFTQALIRSFSQVNPLPPEFAFEPQDTVKVYKEKLVNSATLYINEINDKLPPVKGRQKPLIDVGRNLRKRIENVRPGVTKGKRKIKGSQIFTDLLNVRKETIIDKIAKAENWTDDEKQLFYNKIDNALTYLNSIKLINKQQKIIDSHPFYVPRLRYGDFFYTVKDLEAPKDDNLKVYQTSYPYAFDTDIQIRKGGRLVVARDPQRKRLEKERQRVKQLPVFKTLTAEGKNRYEFSEIHSRTIDSVTKTINEQDVSIIESLAEKMGYGLNNPVKSDVETKVVSHFLKEMRDHVKGKGFDTYLTERSGKIVNGYYTPENKINYLSTTVSDYLRTVSDSASNLEYYGVIDKSIKDIEEVEGPGADRLVRIANKLVEDINNPNEPGSMFKSIAFFFAIGNNFASSMVNLSQSFVATVPVLNAIIGFKGGSATKEIVKAMSDAFRLFQIYNRLDSYGFRFDEITKPKEYTFLTQDEWGMLRNLHSKGVIQAIVNIDLGAKYKRAIGEVGRLSNPKLAEGWAKVMDASAFFFGAAEQVNRIAAALATYRLAQKPGNLAKFKSFADTNMFAYEGEMTPEQAARMIVYVTQFVVSKENRPEKWRGGFMNVATQFLSFVMQYAGLYAKALNIAKVEPRIAAYMIGGLVLSMMFFGGVMGLPYLDNLRSIIARLTRELDAEYEFDLEFAMREMMADSEFNPKLINMLMRGVVTEVSGIDVSKRIGTGEVIPFDLMAGDLMVATGPFGNLAADSVSRAIEGLRNDNKTAFFTAAVPLGIRYALEGAASIMDSSIPVRSTQGRVLMPGEELGLADKLIRMAGFTPKKVAVERHQRAYQRYLKRRPRSLQDKYLKDLARTIVRSQKAREAQRMDEYIRYKAEIKEIYKEINRINKEKREAREYRDYIKITARALRDRLLIERFGQSSIEGLRLNASRTLKTELTPKRLRALGFGD